MSENLMKFAEKLSEISNESKILTNEPMSEHTTFKAGGPADIFVIPDTQESLVSIVKKCIDEDVPYYVIGRGSNLLVGDKGFRGVIISIYNTLNSIYITKSDEECYEVSAGAGIMLTKLAMTVAGEGLSGLEFAAGIPGTLGGAVTMNAGAYGGEIKECIKYAITLDKEGKVCKLNKDELELSYRNSVILKKELIVLEAVFELKKGDKKTILSTIEDFNSRRRDKQPLEFPSAGSTFKRPEGYFAGKLIQDSGLAGYRVGGACVSTKHCGFVVNDKNGNASDIINVIKDVDAKVFDKFGVHLEPEVRMIGEF